MNNTTPALDTIGTYTIADCNTVVISPLYTVTSSSSSNNCLTTASTIDINGDAMISGRLTVQGIDVVQVLAKIQDRLAILIPDPALLEQYEALTKAYNHYKTLEALCVPHADNQKSS